MLSPLPENGVGSVRMPGTGPRSERSCRSVHPELLACLGATAGQALLGSDFRITQHRGEVAPTRPGLPALVTVHPSSVLRTPPQLSHTEAMEAFVRDLRQVAGHLSSGKESSGERQ